MKFDPKLEDDVHIIFVGNYWPYIYGGTRIFRCAKSLAKLGYPIHIFTMPLNKLPNTVNGVTIHEVAFPGDIYRHMRTFINWISGIKSNETNTGLKDRVIGKIAGKSSLKSNLLNYAFKLFSECFGYPDVEKSWHKELYNSLDRFLTEMHPKQVVIISEYPITSHLVVSELAKKHKFFWIADFVDLWSENHNYPYGRVRRFFDRRLEKKTLSNADVISSVYSYESYWAQRLRDLHPRKKIISVPHGFDLEEYQISKPKTLYSSKTDTGKDQLEMLYAGRVYKEMQDINMFFRALAEVNRSHSKFPISVVFYSPDKHYLLGEAEKEKVLNYVRVFEQIPREQILEKMRHYDVLLALGIDNGIGRNGIVPSKVYDYIIAQRPIFVSGGIKCDAVHELVTKTNLGSFALTYEQCVSELRRLIECHRQKRLQLDSVREDELIKFSQQHYLQRLINAFSEQNLRDEDK